MSRPFEAGRFARAQARENARRGARDALREQTGVAAEHNYFALGLCPVKGPEDRAAVLFSESFLGAIRGVVDSRFQEEFRYDVKVSVQQTNVRARPASQERLVGRMALAYWDGAVAAVFAAQSHDTPSIPEMQHQLEIAWGALSEVAAELGGRGETHAVLLVNAEHPAAARAPVRPELIERRAASFAARGRGHRPGPTRAGACARAVRTRALGPS